MLTPRRLLITDGSPEALAALTLQDRPDQTILWVPELEQAGASRRMAAVKRQAEHFRTDRVIGPGANATTSESASRPALLHRVLADAKMLIEALIAASESRCGRVIWPCQAGFDLDRMATVQEIVTCAAHLAQLDPSTRGFAPVVRTPLLDCTDEQVVDLIRSGGAPLALSWWCEHESAEPCGACESCGRWESAGPATTAAA